MSTPPPATRRMPRPALVLSAALLLVTASPAQSSEVARPSDAADAVPTRSLGIVTIFGSSQPTALPTQIPATMEGVTREEIARTVNATDSEDALKYFPSLLVRKRYIGDYNHAILSSRASGTGNSARSAVYADGMLLSNYLGNGVGGLSFPPRWGMVTPEEIGRVDVMYGPFSAAFPGNSVGAVVVYTTRMPKAFEAHAEVGYTRQPFELYNTHTTFRAWQASASFGNKVGDWSWLLGVNRTDSQGQPLTFATRLVGGSAGSGGTPVSGAVLSADNTNQPWYVLGTGTQYDTRQDHFKARIAHDLTPTLRVNYALGVWRNTSEGRPESYLRNALGQPVFSGGINIDGHPFTTAGQSLTGGVFALTNESLVHTLQGLTIKSNTRGEWDWEAGVSMYDYRNDEKRQNGSANPLPNAATGGAGTLADGSGSGWVNLALKGSWRPAGIDGAHVVDFGLQRDSYELRYRTSRVAGNWLSDPAGVLDSSVGGKAETLGVYAQDAWAFAGDWRTVLGARLESWKTRGGFTQIPGATPTAVNIAYADRSESDLSPKAAVSYQVQPDLVLKAAIARAVRYPTVGELYGATSTTNSLYINDPKLRPEKSWTTELTAEKDLGHSLLRLTVFTERTQDALYSQTTFDPVANRNVSRVQNVGRIQTQGLEVAFKGDDVLKKGLDLSGSVTCADSVIRANGGFVLRPGDTIGKRQPNIPKWRATALASYRLDERWSASLGARYSGAQFRTLNNADVNGATYQGVSSYLTTDVRVRVQIDRQWSAAFGVDNLNDDKYWNFHPYPQRSYSAELRFDL